MYKKKPTFEITNAKLDEIAEIPELVGHVNNAASVMMRRFYELWN